MNTQSDLSSYEQITVSYWQEVNAVNVTDTEPLEQIEPVFDLDFVPRVRQEELGQSKIKVISLLVIVIVFLICIACCIFAYYYHKSAGELLETHDDVEGRKPLS